MQIGRGLTHIDILVLIIGFNTITSIRIPNQWREGVSYSEFLNAPLNYKIVLKCSIDRYTWSGSNDKNSNVNSKNLA